MGEFIIQLAALLLTAAGIVFAFLRERTKLDAKFQNEITKMDGKVVQLRTDVDKSDGKLQHLENAVQDDRQQINQMIVKDDFYEKQMAEVKGSIETLHGRINQSEKNILKEMKEAIKDLKADLK